MGYVDNLTSAEWTSYHAKETAIAVESSVGKTIVRAVMDGDGLALTLGDTSTLVIADFGQCCCEDRYMTTDDTLSHYHGAKFLGVEVNRVDSQEGHPDHEIAFLDVLTSAGVLTVQTHNEHNGFYGGFSLAARVDAGK